MKGGVEAGHLDDPRISLGQRSHRPQVVGLVEWGERNKTLERHQDGGVHDHGGGVDGTTAHDSSRVRSLSARMVNMIGTRAASTMPAASARERKLRFLTSMFPASRSGTTSTSGSPATGETIFLVRAASTLMALSNARGPS